MCNGLLPEQKKGGARGYIKRRQSCVVDLLREVGPPLSGAASDEVKWTRETNKVQKEGRIESSRESWRLLLLLFAGSPIL